MIDLDSKGIYGIYIDDKLVYIGKTNASFRQRLNAHLYKLRHKDRWGTQMLLYEMLDAAKKQGKHVWADILIDVHKLDLVDSRKCTSIITNRDIECMELALITLYQPICNQQGITKPYPLSKF